MPTDGRCMHLSIVVTALPIFWLIYASILMDHLDLTFGLQCLFQTPLNNYDAVILLHRDRLPHPQRLLFPSELNQGRHGLKAKLLVKFNPLMCLVGDVEAEFSGTMKWWYDYLGGDAIGLTWERSRKENTGKQSGKINTQKTS
ncbi:hypothetical protein SLEP1_g8003 [Rubroshorea leprosula]|uniref:Nrap protein domain-containing protein n=1 Tax=Rubroshorea leprosula TaxID=152421 RepID=A0AAV5I9H1_9ROSI|nr:hypothetical protein SLEP1_g8003 [Rubroshorea leprosula]